LQQRCGRRFPHGGPRRSSANDDEQGLKKLCSKFY
jgi:hypothetical protein